MLYQPTSFYDARAFYSNCTSMFFRLTVHAKAYPGCEYRPLTVGDQYTIPTMLGPVLYHITDIYTAPRSTKITGVRLAPIDGSTVGHHYSLSHFNSLLANGRLIAR